MASVTVLSVKISISERYSYNGVQRDFIIVFTFQICLTLLSLSSNHIKFGTKYNLSCLISQDVGLS